MSLFDKGKIILTDTEKCDYKWLEDLEDEQIELPSDIEYFYKNALAVIDENNCVINLSEELDTIDTNKQLSTSKEDNQILRQKVVYDESSTVKQIHDAYVVNNSLVEIKEIDDKVISMVIEDNKKLSDVIDRIPYGIIDKSATGIGATTLEMYSPRNSIIVFPTKALASSKASLYTEEKGPNSCLYVGSKTNEFNNSSNGVILNYIFDSSYEYKKFFVVADSLARLLNLIEKDNFDKYFLMVDEVDTLQSDSTYRSSLEVVMDYYERFNYYQRAVVSATIKDFTNPVLEKESVVKISYKNPVKRLFSLVYTRNENLCTVNKIKELLTNNPDDKILIAYNSIDAILICIELLKTELGDEIEDKIGILCGEYGKEKVGELRIELQNCRLSRQIVFMTCAYFAGLDILDDCNIIAVSSFNQPFTLLSIERLFQIVGRCRNKVLKEYVIYSTSQRFISNESYREYKSNLIDKVNNLIEAIIAFKKVTDKNPNYNPTYNYIDKLIDAVAYEKVGNDYPVRIVRRNSISGELVPFYFNIDSCLERWKLYNRLYTSDISLPKKLLKLNQDIKTISILLEKTETQKEISEKISELSKSKAEEACINIKSKLLEYSDDRSNDQLLKQIKNESKNLDRRAKVLVNKFLFLVNHYEGKYLFDILFPASESMPTFKRTINSMVFYALDEKHPLKILVYGTFSYSEENVKNRKLKFSHADKNSLMKVIFDTYFAGMSIKKTKPERFFKCCFKLGKTKKLCNIKGINPLDINPPFNPITETDNEKVRRMLYLD